MGIQAKLFLDDEEFNVLESDFSFEQNTYKAGRPTSFTEFKGIRIVVESKKGNPFFEWATTLKETKQAELHFLPRILGSSKTRKLYLIDALCVSYKLNFSNSGSQPMTETIVLSCGGVKNSDAETEYSAYWRETFPTAKGEETTITEEEPKILEHFLESKKGKKITDKLKNKQEVYLVLKTENMVGKTVDVDLSDSDIDFEYNGAIAENDIIKNISITSDLMKLKLKALKNS